MTQLYRSFGCVGFNMTIATITVIKPLESLKSEYVIPFNNSVDDLVKVIGETILKRPLKNKFGRTLTNNKFNKNIDLLEWLINTSWLDAITSLNSEIAQFLKPYNGFMKYSKREGDNVVVCINFGSCSKEKIEMYLLQFEDMIQSLHGTIKYTKIKTFSEVREATPESGDSLPEVHPAAVVFQG